MILLFQSYLLIPSFIGLIPIFTRRCKKGKLRVKNLFFIIAGIFSVFNLLLLGISHYIQITTGYKGKNNFFNLDGIIAWDIAMKLYNISLLILILCFIYRIVISIIGKINRAEHIILLVINLICLNYVIRLLILFGI